jgi:hypothetical protein
MNTNVNTIKHCYPDKNSVPTQNLGCNTAVICDDQKIPVPFKGTLLAAASVAIGDDQKIVIAAQSEFLMMARRGA